MSAGRLEYGLWFRPGMHDAEIKMKVVSLWAGGLFRNGAERSAAAFTVGSRDLQNPLNMTCNKNVIRVNSFVLLLDK